jgi:RHS repeat-associated protein
MLMPGRSFSSEDYRFGFGGHEKVDEASGSGNTVDMGDRWLDVRLGRTPKMDAKANKYSSLSPYSYAANSPLIFIDPDGKDIIPVHGTWSNINTWENLNGIRNASKILFGDNNLGVSFPWSGANYAELRTKAAIQLVDHIRTQMQSKDFNGEITLVGHSHGGNISIEALNMIVDMKEFDNVQLNLLTINTPVREDYQLSKKAVGIVSHVNVYDPKDPVQSNGGNSMVVLPDLPRTPDFMDANTKGTGEYGSAGRTFKNAKNIKVDNPQGIINGWKLDGGIQSGDYHNSHNRVDDWINKTEEK